MVALALALGTAVYFVARDLCNAHEVALPRLPLGLVALAIAIGSVLAVAACRSRQQRIALAVLAICGAAMGALLPPVPGGSAPIQVVATGEHNARSTGSEVWLPDVVPGRIYFEGAGWERRDGRLSVSWQAQPSTATLRGPWREGDVLRLATHPGSGIVELRVGDHRERIDLYSPTEGAVTVTLPTPRRSPVRAVLHGALPLLLMLAIGGVLLRLPRPWPLLLVAGAVLGAATLWAVHGRSYPGALELIAYGEGDLARLQADIGNGMFEVPIGAAAGGRSIETTLPHPGAESLRLRAASGSLQPLSDLEEPGLRIARTESLGTPVCDSSERVQLFQWNGDRSGPLQLDSAGLRTSLSNTPAVASARTPAYVVVVCDGASVRLYTTTAHIAISPWQQPWWQAREIRALTADGDAMSLLQLSGDRRAGFVALAPASDGASAPHHFMRPDTRAMAIEKVIAAALVALLPALLWLAGTNLGVMRRYWTPGTRALALLCYAAPPMWIAATMLVQWPGTVGWDAYSPYIQMHTGTVTLWYGIGYPLVIGALSLLMAPAWIGVAQCVVMALLVQAVTVRALQAPPRWRWVGAATCLLLPLTVIAWGATVHLRDAMNGTLMALFGVGWFYTMVDGPRWRRGRRGLALGLLALLALGLVLLRVDNIVFVGVALAAAPLLTRRGRRATTGFAVAVLALCLVANAVMERMVYGSRAGLAAEKNFYRQTAFINPLVGYLADPDSRLPEAQKAALAQHLAPLFDLPMAIRNWKPTHVIWWHEAVAGKPPPSAEQIAALQRDYVGTALQDPLRFLRMRTAMFLSTLGHKWIAVPPVPATPGAQVLLDRMRMPHDAETGATAKLIGFDAGLRPWPHWSDRLQRLAEAVATTLPQFIVCLVLLGFARRTPVAAVLALALLGRAAVFFFFAPADVFLYLFDMHVLGFLLPAMAVQEWARRRSRGPFVKERES